MVLWSRTVVSFLVLMTPVETPLLLPPLASSGIGNMSSASDKEYQVSTTRGRHFSGTVGLRSGYEKGGMEFNRSDLLEAFTSWMKERHRNKEKFVGAISVWMWDGILLPNESDNQTICYYDYSEHRKRSGARWCPSLLLFGLTPSRLPTYLPACLHHRKAKYSSLCFACLCTWRKRANSRDNPKSDGLKKKGTVKRCSF